MNRPHLLAAGALVTAIVGAVATPGSAFVSSPDLVAVADAPAVRAEAVPVGDPAPPPTTAAPSPAADVVALTNVARTAAGVPPVVVDPAVQRAAEVHSADQAAMGRMTHAGSDGSNAGDRLERAGYVWGTWAENVAAGQPGATDVTDAWLASPGHRVNMLNAAYEHIGVAVAHDASGVPYWTMVLAAD